MLLNSYLKKYVLLPIADRFMKTSIQKRIVEINKLKFKNKEEIIFWQNNQLKKLIRHAYNNTSYYRKLFNNNNLRPEDIQTVEDLKLIPPLTKEIIRKYNDELIPANIESIPYKKSATGGSTGDPMIYFLDNKSWSYINANNILNWEKTSYRFGKPYIALGSTSLYIDKTPSLKHKIYYRFKNKIALSGINMSDEVCRKYFQIIIKKEIKYLYGYASSIYLLAKYAKENAFAVSIEACFPTSEILLPHYEETIQKAFKCKIVNCYGANDGGLNAFKHGDNFFHVGYNAVFHLRNVENSIGPLEVTDLFNYAMPFINYQSGDNIKIANTLSDDYNGQIFESVVGRSSDIIALENGNILTGPGFTILFKDIPVEHYCIEKVAKNSIVCKIVKTDTYTTEHENIVNETIKKHLGQNTTFKISYIDSPTLSKSGKRVYFINKHIE